MTQTNQVRDCFSQPGEFHNHPGGISRVVVGPDVRQQSRPAALNSERLVVHTNEYEPGGTSGDGHVHADQEQAFFILEGQMEATVGDEVITAEPGDLVLLPRNVWHKHRNTGDGALKFLFLSAKLD